jgi:hypothetical protein
LMGISLAYCGVRSVWQFHGCRLPAAAALRDASATGVAHAMCASSREGVVALQQTIASGHLLGPSLPAADPSRSTLCKSIAAASTSKATALLPSDSLCANSGNPFRVCLLRTRGSLNKNLGLLTWGSVSQHVVPGTRCLGATATPTIPQVALFFTLQAAGAVARPQEDFHRYVQR